MTKSIYRSLATALTFVICAASVARPLSAREPLEPPQQAQPKALFPIRVSVSSLGEQGNQNSGWSHALVISSDGQRIAFDSEATNLAEGMGGFIHDRTTGQTKPVVRGFDNAPLSYGTWIKSFSTDGRYVLFDSVSSNVLPDLIPNGMQVFLLDRQTGKVRLISTDAEGKPRTNSNFGKLSGNGRYVVYGTFGSYNSSTSLILRDLWNDQEIVIIPSPTTPRYLLTDYEISDDGRYVVIEAASDLLPGGRDISAGWNVDDVYLFDRLTQTLKRISTNTNGEPPNDRSSGASISGDGSVVVFTSQATNLVECSGPCPYLILYKYDTASGKLSPLVDDPKRPPTYGWNSSVSQDGNLVAFISNVGNLVPNDTNICDASPNCQDAFVYNRSANQMTRVSMASDGSQSNGRTNAVVISGDGSTVAFASEATNLVENDTNGVIDIFVNSTNGTPSQLSCTTGIGVQISFPPLFRLRLVADDPFTVRRWTYESVLQGSICPESAMTFGLNGDPTQLAESEPIVTIKSPSGLTTKASSRGDVETQLPVIRGFPKPGVGVTLEPPALFGSLSKSWEVRADDFGLENQHKAELSVSIKPPRVSPRFLIAVAQAGQYIVIGFGVVILSTLTPALNSLILLYQGPSTKPTIPAAIATTNLESLSIPLRTKSAPPQHVIENLQNTFGSELIAASTVSSLVLDSGLKAPGEVLSIQGSDFIPGGLVYVSLTSPENPNAFLEFEARADDKGKFNKEIQIPTTAGSGGWLVAAFDMSGMYSSLEKFANGQSTTMSFYVAANEFAIPYYSRMPIINR